MPNFKITTEGKRFDLEKAEKLGTFARKDDTRGSTGYKTASGNYVLHNWSRWQGEGESWEVVTRERMRDLAIRYWTANEVSATFPEVKNLEDEV